MRGWATRDEFVGASADAVVLAPAQSTDDAWAERLAEALGARRAAAAGAAAPARREPVWLVREYAHTEFGYPHGRSYDAAAGGAQLRAALRAGALPVAAYAPTSVGYQLGAIGHLPKDRGIHFNDAGRLLLAQLVLNALSLRMAAPRARLARTRNNGHGRRSHLKVTSCRAYLLPSPIHSRHPHLVVPPLPLHRRTRPTLAPPSPPHPS